MTGISQAGSKRVRAGDALRQRLAAKAKALKELADQKFALDQHVIVAVTDAEGSITYVNDKFCAISRYSREELIGRNHQILNTRHHSKKSFRQMYNVIANGQVWHGEVQNRAKDGSIYWVDTTIAPSSGENGKPRQYVAISTDITAHKRAEEQLAGHRAELSRQATELTDSREALETQTLMLQSVLNSIGEGLVAADEHGKFILWNPAANKIVGMGAADVSSQDWSKHYGVFLPDTVTPFPPEQNPLARAIQGTACTAEMFLRNRELPDGAWIEANAQPLKGADGEHRGGVVAFRDITHKKQAQQEIKQLNVALEQRVAERTAQLEEANEALESFTYSVAHDLRAPLRHIAGFSGILMEEFSSSLEPRAQSYLHWIEEGTRKMGQLVDELLNLARVGRQAANLQQVNLNSMIEEVLRILQPEIEGRQIEWKIDDLPLIECDPTLVKQVFQNLISNALKYSRPRSLAVIEIGQTLENGSSAIFVRDNGVGFDMKYVDKLFGVFQRLHRSEDFEGIGVGLATVQRIIKKHQGKVWAESELDRGATFHFTLDGLQPAKQIEKL